MPEQLMALKEDFDQVSEYSTDSDSMPVHDGQRLAKKVAVPSSVSDTGEPGQWAEDGSYLYICTATDTWRRVGLGTW